MGNEPFRLLFPAGYPPPERCALPDTDFIHALQLDQMIGIRRESYRGIADLHLEQFFSCEPAVLAYRAELILEIADSEPLQALVRDALPLIRDTYEMRKVLNRGDGSLESGLSSTRYIEQYLELVELFRAAAAERRDRRPVCQRKLSGPACPSGGTGNPDRTGEKHLPGCEPGRQPACD